MRNIIITLVLLISFKSLAQDPQLLANSWDLQKLIINQTEYSLPSPSVTAEVFFMVTSLGILHPYCEETAVYEIQYLESNLFTANFDVGLIGTCTNMEAMAFYAKHLSIYAISSDNLSYSLNTVNTQTTLTVTTPNGDQAIYGNTQLTKKTFEQLEFAIFPNPVQHFLNFSDLKQSETANLKVYDVFGKEVLFDNAVNWSNSSIDVSGLLNGVYVIRVQMENGAFMNKKFVKY